MANWVGKLGAGAAAVGMLAYTAQKISERKGAGLNSGLREEGGTVIPLAERAFMERLHRANQLEVRAGRLAREHAADPRVRAYGEFLIEQHTQADQALLDRTRARGISLGTPLPLNAAEVAIIAAQAATEKKLQALSGKAFDHAFLAAMLDDHDHVIAVVKLGAGSFAGTELGSMLRELLPKLVEHRRRALELASALSPDAEIPPGDSASPPAAEA